MSLEGERKASRKKPWYQDVDGCRIPGLFSPEAFRSAMSYKPRSDDLFIVTFPKCGTTWVQNIVACIFKEGRPFESALESFSDTPFLEMVGAKAGEELKRPAALKMHLPFYKMPSSPEAKYIYIARNPKNFLSTLNTMSLEGERKALRKKPWYQDVDGWRIPGLFSPEAFRSAMSYKPRSDDLFIVTFPKCGTTWVQNIVACIFKEGRPFESALEFFSDTPFLEMVGAKAGEELKRPAALKMHLPFYKMPWSPEAKYIYIARNPKDCCVSFYHFEESMPLYRFEDGQFDDFFELFINGETDFGDYFDTTFSWYEHRNEPNVLFLTYEQLKRDTKTYVMKIAGFLGIKYKEMLEKDEKMLQDVIHYSSFSFMKEFMNKKMVELMAMPRDMIEQNPDIPSGLRTMLLSGDFKLKKEGVTGIPIVRKGIIGDWRNYFSPTQNARIEKKFREKFAGTDLLDLWQDDMYDFEKNNSV